MENGPFIDGLPIKNGDYVDQTVEATPNSSELASCSWSSQVLEPPKKPDCLNKAIPDTC